MFKKVVFYVFEENIVLNGGDEDTERQALLSCGFAGMLAWLADGLKEGEWKFFLKCLGLK